MRRKRILAALVSVSTLMAVLLAVTLVREHRRLYRVTVLPSLGGRETAATGINNQGQITGFATAADGSGRFFLWDRVHGMRDLGPVSRPSIVHINDVGQIAGTTQDARGNLLAFVWDPTRGIRTLGTLGGRISVAMGLNNHVQIVGQSQTAAGSEHAFLWDEATGMQDLGTLGGTWSAAWSINDAGLVFGRVASPTRAYEAFFWERDKGMVGTGPAGSNDGGEPMWSGINSRGYVLGQDGNQVFLWRKDLRVRPLFPRPGSHIQPVINDANQAIFGETSYSVVVPRWARRFVEPTRRCYLWDPVRGKVPLDRDTRLRLGEVFYALDLNDKGCVVGVLVKEHRMRARAVLLEPIPKRWGK